MKNLKRILTSVIVMIMAVAIVSNTFFASAADYGTYKDGLKAASGNYHLYASRIEGNHPSLDFEKGLEGWTTKRNGRYASAFGEIKTEKDENGNENTYVTLTGQENYDGIYSVKFTDPRIKVDDQLSIIIKWRGPDKSFQPILYQIKDDAKGNYKEYVRLADNGIQEQLEYPESEDDWGVILCTGLKSKVVEPDKGDSTMLFSIGLEIFGDLTLAIDLDDVQIVKYNASTKVVRSLDDKILYDMNAIASEGAKFNSEVYGDFGIDFSKKYEAPKPDSTDGLKNIKNTAVKEDDGKSDSKALLWIVIACCVVLISAAAVFLVVIIKKKSAQNVTDGEEEENSDAPQDGEEANTDETDNCETDSK